MAPRHPRATSSDDAAVAYLRDQKRTDEVIGAMASCMYLAHYFGSDQEGSLRALIHWLQISDGLLSTQHLEMVRASVPKKRTPPKFWSAREEVPPALDTLLGPLYELDVAVRALETAVNALEPALRLYGKHPAAKPMLVRHGLFGRTVALLDHTAETLGIKVLKPMEIAAVSVLARFEEHTDDRKVAEARARAWADHRQKGSGVREAFRRIFFPETSLGSAPAAPPESAPPDAPVSGGKTPG